jgi:hypothetical protein
LAPETVAAAVVVKVALPSAVSVLALFVSGVLRRPPRRDGRKALESGERKLFHEIFDARPARGLDDRSGRDGRGRRQARRQEAARFFVEPKNNATVTSPVHMKFGSEGITIAAVPAGEVTTVRPGIAHYHVGIDQDCLPAGKNIVRARPHGFISGTARTCSRRSSRPGKHKLALQLGDDKHDTMPGTCEVITVDVKP